MDVESVHAAIKNENLSAALFYLVSLRSLVSLNNVKINRIAFLQRLISLHLDRTEVTEHVSPFVATQKAIALSVIEPFHGARNCATMLLGRLGRRNWVWGRMVRRLFDAM